MKKLNADKHYTTYLYLGFAWAVIVLIMFLLTSCYGTYYITDAEYSDLREEHASVTYYDNQIYWGWHSGYYYYYGTPHYYPWYYYYNVCPPSHYTHTTHVIISRPVNKPTHRPNRPTHRPNIRTKSNTNVIVTPNTNTKVKTNINYTRPKSNTKVKTNRSNTNKVKSNRSSNTRTKSNNRKPR
eukprot:SAG11_NODE_33_length_22289_cov_12.857999_6_plen_183_part_00